jgi:hypothetical protein
MTTMTRPRPPALFPPSREDLDAPPESRVRPSRPETVQSKFAPLSLPAGIKDWLLLGLACATLLCLPLLVLATSYMTARFGSAGYLLLCGVPPLVLAWEALARSATDET